MELELGLKITHNRDDLISTADFRVTKDPSTPIFVSKETDTKFVLVGHLTGFKKESIVIEINEAGNRIAVSGKKPVQELVFMGWIMQEKEVEVRAFRTVFRIPDEVNLDNIKAKFNEEMPNLTIIMPKKVKGFVGDGIEEVKEEDVDRGRPETVEAAADKVQESESKSKEIWQESNEPKRKEEIHQVAETKVCTNEPAMEQLVADKVVGNGSVKEAPKEEIVEEKMKGNQDSGQVVLQTIDQRQLEEAKAIPEFPERDKSGVIEKEKPEESQEMDGGRESRTSQNAAEAAAERVEVSSLQKESREPEVKNREENDQIVDKSPRTPQVELQASADNVEPLPETFRETATSETKEEAERLIDRSQTKEKPETEETRKRKLPEDKAPELVSEKHVPGPEITKSTESRDDEVPKQSEFATDVEEKHTLSKDVQVASAKQEELQKREPSTKIQELAKPEEPCQVPEPEKTPDPSIEEETNQEISSEENADEHEFQEFEIQKCLKKDAAQMKKHVQKKTKVCTPLVVAGSALLVSLIVFVIHFIRAKKR